MTPQQWRRPDPSETGPRKLLLALLAVTASDLRPGHSREGDRAAARQWIEDVDDDGLFSFRAICGFLNVDPDQARRAVLNGHGQGSITATGRSYHATRYPPTRSVPAEPREDRP
jgi:hypothetical protein